MTYALPTGIIGFSDITSYMVSVVPSAFNYILITLWIIIFLGLRMNNISASSAAFTAASFVCFWLALFLSITSLVANNMVFLTLLALGFGIAWMYNEARTR